jgi:hypothetical protein
MDLVILASPSGDTESRMTNGASGSQRPEDRKPEDEPPDLPEESFKYERARPPGRPGAPQIPEEPEEYLQDRRSSPVLVLLFWIVVVVVGVLLLWILFRS